MAGGHPAVNVNRALFAILVSILLLFVSCGAQDYKDPHTVGNRQTFVHLFEWRWDDIAEECERFLGPYGFGGIQISPPNENMINWTPTRPWYERYQPVSYKLVTRSGNEEQFADMVHRCNKAGVRIYADVVINHMTAGTKGSGTGGSSYDGTTRSYPAVPYGPPDFNDCSRCKTSSCSIENYNDPDQVRNCALLGLNDLNQGKDYVRDKIVEYLNKLINYGVAGFRIDASKHMWPGDLEAIRNRLRDLNPEYFPMGSRPFIFQEVIGLGNEPILPGHYAHIGRVTEFKYSFKLGTVFHKNDYLKYLKNFGEGWGFINSGDAVIFIDNHDNQRGHGVEGFTTILTHFESRLYKMATAFMLAWPYGYPKLMSSYHWDRNIQDNVDTNDWVGPPHDDQWNTKRVSINADLTCGNGWVCEHRWRQMYNMVEFRNVAVGTKVENWWDNGFHQIAFSRGDKAFIAINNDNSPLTATVYTRLAPGQYCDVISGNLQDGGCTGQTITVENDGKINLNVNNAVEDPMIAIHVNSKL